MITYLVGDATEPKEGASPTFIVHIVNTVGAWGAGFVVALSRKWREPEAEYREWSRQVWFTLGRVQRVPVSEGVWVYNMLAQNGLPSRMKSRVVDYAALRSCLTFVAAHARQYGASIHMPRIGTGLGGGSWEEIEPIIEDTCRELDVFVYDLP